MNPHASGLFAYLPMLGDILFIPGKEKPYIPDRLMDALAGICSHPVTVISAPSGAGKTTAVKEFLAVRQALGARVLWYTAFGETPDTAWRHICELLAEADAETAALMQNLNFPVRQTLSALARLISRLEVTQETVQVIDNSQMIKTDVRYELMLAISLMGNVNRWQAGVLLGLDELPGYSAKLLDRGGFIQYDAGRRTYVVHSPLREFLVPTLTRCPRRTSSCFTPGRAGPTCWRASCCPPWTCC